MRVRKKAGDADDANVGESNTEAEGQWRKYVSHEDKTKEITSWLRWTREKHIREISLYERFTVSADREVEVYLPTPKLFPVTTMFSSTAPEQ